MAEPECLGKFCANTRDLIALADGMEQGDHLSGHWLFVRRGQQPIPINKVGFWTANGYADAKARVRNIIAWEVGGKRADEIMRQVLGRNWRRDGWTRFWKPNRSAMTKQQLRQALYLAGKATIETMSPSQRERLIRQLESRTPADPAAFMRDKETNKLVHLAVHKTDSAKLVRFLDAVDTFEQRVRQAQSRLTNATPNEREKEIMQLHKLAMELQQNFVNGDRPDKIELEKSIRRSINGSLAVHHREMNDYATLFQAAKQEVAERLARSVVERLMEHETTDGEILSYNDSPVRSIPRQRKESNALNGSSDASPSIDDHSDDEDQTNSSSLQRLHKIRLRLSDGRHLRQHGNILYSMSNFIDKWYDWRDHSQVSPKVAEPIDAAKQTVQRFVSSSLRETGSNHNGKQPEDVDQLAATIMQPYMSNGRALGSPELKHIISRIGKARQLRADVMTLIENQLEDDDLNTTLSMERCFLKQSKERGLFARYLTLQGEQHKLTQYDELFELQEEVRSIAESKNHGPDGSPTISDEAKNAALQVYRRYECAEFPSDVSRNQFRSLLLKLKDEPAAVSFKDIDSLDHQVARLKDSLLDELKDVHFERFKNTFGDFDPTASPFRSNLK